MANELIPVEHEEEEKPILTNTHPPISRELLYLGGIVLGMLFLAFLWSALAPLDSVTIAPGVVAVVSNNKVIQNQQGGIVEKIFVKEGQTVQKGEPIIQLSDPQTLSKRDSLQHSVYFQYAKTARLQAILNNASKVTFPPALMILAKDPEIAQLMEAEQDYFTKGLLTHLAEVKILEEQLGQIQQQYIQAQALLKSSLSQKKYLAEELEAVKFLESKKLARKPRLLALERENARLEGESLKLQSELERINKQKGEIEARINTAVQTRKQKALTELEDSQKQLLEIPPQLSAAEEMHSGLLIKAPVSGTVKGLRFRSIGEVVKPADPIMEIVPSGDQLIVEAHVDPTDIDVVAPHLPAKVQISALSYRYTPMIFGKVEWVSPDIFVDQNTHRSYYLVRISDFDPQWKHLEDKLVPGMSVEVMIVNSQHSLFSYLWAPIRDSFRKAFRED